MIIKDNHIVKCTESELRDRWLGHYDDIMTFDDYKEAISAAGTIIVKDEYPEADVETVRRCRSCRWARLCSQVIEHNGAQYHIDYCSLFEGEQEHE